MLNMIVDLLENAKKESTSDQLIKLIDYESEIILAPLDICANTRSYERLLRIFQTVPLIKFLYQLAAISHKKVIIQFNSYFSNYYLFLIMYLLYNNGILFSSKIHRNFTPSLHVYILCSKVRMTLLIHFNFSSKQQTLEANLVIFCFSLNFENTKFSEVFLY